MLSLMPSKTIFASYILDWAVIVAFAAAGGGLNFVQGKRRPFSLLNLEISYPLQPSSISVVTLGLVALAAPAFIIFLITAIFVPGPKYRRTLKRSEIIRRKLWELHAGLIGLALSAAVAFFVTQGFKIMIGKPRPHLIALCEPDLQNIASHVVGGYGQDISARWTLVDWTICTQQDKKALSDGFRSFPSGHCSFSWSGLLYISLFISSKFAIAIPSLGMFTNVLTQPQSRRSNDTELLPLRRPPQPEGSSDSGKFQQLPDANDDTTQPVPLYSQAATPPNWGLVLVFVPLAVAAYITSTRYNEYWHFGFDIVGGSLIGIFSAWFSFRWYHLPIRRGHGWAWGPRAKSRAFGIGVGTGNYALSER